MPPDPFSPAGRFEERRREAEQQRAIEAERRKAAAEGRSVKKWAR